MEEQDELEGANRSRLPNFVQNITICRTKVMERGIRLWAPVAVSTLSATSQGLQVNRLDSSTIAPAVVDATLSRLMKAGESHSVKPVSLLGSPSPADVMAFEKERAEVLSQPRTLPNLVCQESVDRFMRRMR